MINKTQLHRPEFAAPNLTLSLDSILVHIIAFFLGRTPVVGIYPLGISITAASSLYRGRFLSIGLAALLGTLTVTRDFMAVKYALAITLFAVLYYALQNKVYNKDLLVGGCIFTSLAAAGLLVFSLKSASLYDYFLIFLEASLALVMTYIIPFGLPGVFKTRTTKIEKSLCIMLIAGAILRFVGNWEPFGISLKEALCTLIVLVAAFAEGSGAGATAGAVLGVMGSPSAAAPWSAGIMAFAGLVGGVFYRLGKYGVVAGFVLGYLILNLYAGSVGEAAIEVPSLILSLIAFVILPSDLLQKVTSYISNSSEEESVIKKEILKDRLYELARFFENLAGALIFPVEEEKQPGFFTRFYQTVKNDVCHGCDLYKTCWEKEFKTTVRSLYEVLKEEKQIPFCNFPGFFKSRCERADEIKRIARDMNMTRNLEIKLETIIKKQREIVLNNYRKTAIILRKLAEGAFPEGAGSGIEEKIKNKLSEKGIRVDLVYCMKNRDKLQINIVKNPCIGGRLCENEIPSGVAEAIGTDVAVKVVECPLKGGSTKCRLKAMPKGSYRVSVGVVSVPKEGAEVSGDSFSFIELESGKFLLAISDGMGVGEKARKESERTLSILEELLDAGYDIEMALDILNSAMQVARSDDSFSTLDMALIDTYSGKAEFVKAGAVTGFIKRGRQVDTVKGGSLPVGIVDSIAASSVRKRLKAGDMIVLLSDGALDSFTDEDDKEKAMLEFLKAASTTNPQELANMILEKVRENKKIIKDDMTVLVGSIWKCQHSL
ncbi:MAG: stage II sporulation protein E [Thermosediminibacteraceae bacterium]|nr:stage II sporulation protein E [Thermosediminibacteraceae bacterium]